LAQPSDAVTKGRAGKARPFAQQSPGQVIWDNVKGFAGVALVFLLLRAFVIEAYRIPSPSMVPTLLVGDWLFVNKFIYGAHVPFTKSAHLPVVREPRRRDVVVFISPYQADEAARGADPLPTLVKRLIGVPGDTLYMRDAVLYINGVAQQEASTRHDPRATDSIDPLFDWQKPVGLRESRFGPAPLQPTHDNWGPLVVPAGYLFMMGDNRYDSKDSRYWGFVPRENMRGQPMFVYYAWNADDSDRAWPAITDIRWSRIGHWIR
jgi:signal peptidase I